MRASKPRRYHSRRAQMRGRISRWYLGYIEYNQENDLSNEAVISFGLRSRHHWTGKFAKRLGGFLEVHWKFVIGAIVFPTVLAIIFS